MEQLERVIIEMGGTLSESRVDNQFSKTITFGKSSKTFSSFSEHECNVKVVDYLTKYYDMYFNNASNRLNKLL